MEIKIIPSPKNNERHQYFWAKYGDRYIGCLWLTQNGNWLVQIWNSRHSTETVASRSEAIARIAKSWEEVLECAG